MAWDWSKIESKIRRLKYDNWKNEGFETKWIDGLVWDVGLISLTSNVGHFFGRYLLVKCKRTLKYKCRFEWKMTPRLSSLSFSLSYHVLLSIEVWRMEKWTKKFSFVYINFALFCLPFIFHLFTVQLPFILFFLCEKRTVIWQKVLNNAKISQKLLEIVKKLQVKNSTYMKENYQMFTFKFSSKLFYLLFSQSSCLFKVF